MAHQMIWTCLSKLYLLTKTSVTKITLWRSTPSMWPGSLFKQCCTFGLISKAGDPVKRKLRWLCPQVQLAVQQVRTLEGEGGIHENSPIPQCYLYPYLTQWCTTGHISKIWDPLRRKWTHVCCCQCIKYTKGSWEGVAPEGVRRVRIWGGVRVQNNRRHQRQLPWMPLPVALMPKKTASCFAIL